MTQDASERGPTAAPTSTSPKDNSRVKRIGHCVHMNCYYSNTAYLCVCELASIDIDIV